MTTGVTNKTTHQTFKQNSKAQNQWHEPIQTFIMSNFEHHPYFTIKNVFFYLIEKACLI